jgi:biopolymer transport protein ExbB
MLDLFIKGGPIMWPLLATSLLALTVTIERLIFIFRESRRREPDAVDKILSFVEEGKMTQAVEAAKASEDFVARTLIYGITHHEKSYSSALLRAANQELKRFSRNLSILDTVVTLAPLLGLLGTVTGMIRSFGLLGGSELSAPTAITGGIAEALIATAFGLGIAIVALIPFNYLNNRLEEARHEIEDAATHLELMLTSGGECALENRNPDCKLRKGESKD